MISAQCDQCFQIYQVKPQMEGKRFRCKEPGCEGIVSVPRANESELKPRPTPLSQRRSPKAAAKQKSSGGTALIVGGIGGVALLLVGVVAFVAFRGGADEQLAQPQDEGAAVAAPDKVTDGTVSSVADDSPKAADNRQGNTPDHAGAVAIHNESQNAQAKPSPRFEALLQQLTDQAADSDPSSDSQEEIKRLRNWAKDAPRNSITQTNDGTIVSDTLAAEFQRVMRMSIPESEQNKLPPVSEFVAGIRQQDQDFLLVSEQLERAMQQGKGPVDAHDRVDWLLRGYKEFDIEFAHMALPLMQEYQEGSMPLIRAELLAQILEMKLRSDLF